MKTFLIPFVLMLSACSSTAFNLGTMSEDAYVEFVNDSSTEVRSDALTKEDTSTIDSGTPEVDALFDVTSSTDVFVVDTFTPDTLTPDTYVAKDTSTTDTYVAVDTFVPPVDTAPECTVNSRICTEGQPKVCSSTGTWKYNGGSCLLGCDPFPNHNCLCSFPSGRLSYVSVPGLATANVKDNVTGLTWIVLGMGHYQNAAYQCSLKNGRLPTVAEVDGILLQKFPVNTCVESIDPMFPFKIFWGWIVGTSNLSGYQWVFSYVTGEKKLIREDTLNGYYAVCVIPS
jgi:hypothetical protein